MWLQIKEAIDFLQADAHRHSTQTYIGGHSRLLENDQLQFESNDERTGLLLSDRENAGGLNALSACHIRISLLVVPSLAPAFPSFSRCHILAILEFGDDLQTVLEEIFF